MWNRYNRLFNGIKINTITCVSYKSHYEALNIPKTATHKEIKDAYYKLSMMYHPDKNKGSEEAAKMFRDITSAYEILGNIRQRRLYDSGANLGKKSTHYSGKKPFETMSTRTDVYDGSTRSRDYNFDEWSKAHYSNAFRRHNEARDLLSRKKMNEEFANRQNTYTVLVVMIVISLFIIISMFDYLKMVVRTHKENEKSWEKND